MKTSIQYPGPKSAGQRPNDSSCSGMRPRAINKSSGSCLWLTLFTGLFFFLFNLSPARAHQSPVGCTGSGLGIFLFTDSPDVHIGDTLNYSITIYNGANVGPVVCDATSITAIVQTPDGVSHPISLVRTNLSSGQSDFYPSVVTYVVRAQDVQSDGTVRARATDTGVIHQNDTDSQGGGDQGVNTEVSLPCIQIAAQCTGSVGENGAITFTGTVTNCGNNTLVGVTVTNFVNGGQYPVTFITNLLAGQVASFSGSWIPANPCSSSTATLTAQGVDQYTTHPRTVTSLVNTTCSDILTPSIVVTKTCLAQVVAPGQLLTFSGSVSNSGNVTLTGIVVINNQPAINTPVFTFASLAPGATTSFTGSYLAPTNCSVTDTLTATAASICGVRVTNSASATCPIQTTPQISITQNCPLNTVNPGALFTYSGTVTNTGNITLTNVTVLNNLSGANPIFTVATLAPGAGANFTGSYLAPTNCFTTSTSTAIGRGACGGAVTNTVSATCAVNTTTALKVTQICPVTPVIPGGLLTFSGTVTNTGNVVITNVTVVNSLSGPTPIFTVASLAPGTGTNFTGSYLAPTNCSATSTMTATGQSICGFFATNAVTSTCAITTTPLITIVQNCPVIPAVPGGLLTYSGSVSNAGNITLTNVVVLNNLSGATPIFTAAVLAPGEVGNFTGSYLASTNCSTTSISTVTSRSICGIAATSSATSTCQILTTPILNITQNCPVNPTVPGALMTYTGTVTNAGNITLTNIVVLNNISGGTPIFTIITLAPGAGANFSGSYLTPTNCSTTSISTVTARSTCGVLMTNTASSTCAIITTPVLKITQNCATNIVVPGGLLTYSGTVTNTGNITITNVVVLNNLSDGTPIFTVATLAPGTGANFTGSYVAPGNCSSTSISTATGQSICGVAVTNAASSTCAITTVPLVTITQTCPVIPVIPGGLLTYSGSVSNAGNIALTNVVVVNNQNGAIPIFTTALLAPGAVTNFTGSYVASTNCSTTSISTVTGRSICGIAVTNTAASTCQIITTPAIVVTQNCPSTPVAPGGILTYSGSVSNAGNITLTNIIVVSDRPADNTTIFTLTSLAPGATANFTGSYQVPLNCCVVFSTIQASGQNCAGVTVTSTYTRTCTVFTQPAIVVTKVCTPGILRPGDLLTYSGSVSNSGNIVLVNVSVADNQSLGNPPLPGPISLAPGESVTFNGSYTVQPDFCGSDIVTASAQDVCTYLPVVNSVTTTCPITTTPRITVTKNCPLLPTLRGGLFTYTGSVSNAGNVSLVGVYVTDNAPTNHTPVIGPITLAPGASVNFTNSYIAPVCCCYIIDTVTATGQDHCTSSNVMATATTVCPLVTIPSIAVVQNCPALPIAMGSVYMFNGYVTNSGDVVLTNVYVFGPLGTNNPVLGPIQLAPHEAEPYVGSYTVPFNICAVTVTTVGSETCGGTTATNSTSCPVANNPSLTLTQNCPIAPVMPGNVLTYSGSVSNAGNITLTGIQILNNQSGTTPVFTAAQLVPGATANYTGSYLAPSNCASPNISTVTGQTLCGVTVTNTILTTCAVITTPRITITQNCPVNPVVPGGVLTYSGSVSNAGNILLTNIVVLNNLSGATPIFTLPALAPGMMTNFTGSYLVSSNCSMVSTSTVTGQSLCGGGATNTANSTCAVTTTPAIAISETCPPGPVAAGSTVVFGGSVTNTGNVSLMNVLVFSSQSSNTPVLGPITLAPGASAPFMGSYIATGGSNPNTNTIITTNNIGSVTTNLAGVITTNTTTSISTNVISPAFGTINPVSAAMTDRFIVPLNIKGLIFADQDENWGPTLFYAIRTPVSGPDQFVTITAAGTTTDRFALNSTNYDSLTISAPDVGYGVNNFYYVRHDAGGVSTFGVIKAAGASSASDLWVLSGAGYNGVAFAAANLGYGANMFYSLRMDTTGVSTFGTINPTPGGIETDLYGVGTNFDALVYVSGIVSNWGTNNFAYLRHTGAGSFIGTINPITHVVMDRLSVGTNTLSDLTFTATDVGYGPNMFYYIRPQRIILTTNNLVTFTTNQTTTLITNSVITYVTNSTVTFTPTNTVTATGMDVCQNRTVGAAANCQGPVTPTNGPIISKPTVVNGTFSMTFPTAIGKTYTLQYKNQLTDPTWTDLQTVTGTGSDQTIADPTAIGQPTRFYRIMVLP